MGAVQVIELTDEQKIAILEKAKEILGPNGEHWTKACWWGVKNDEGRIAELLEEWGYQPDPTESEFKQLDEDTDHELSRRSVDTPDADKANVWCLMGALEEAAWRLRIVEARDASERLAAPISLERLVDSKDQWRAMTVIDVNDNPETEWSDIRDLLDERLAQLKETT